MKKLYKCLWILLEFLLIEEMACGQEENAALWGKSSQSSTYKTSDPDWALDGLLTSWTHTNPETNPWWRVDLLKVYRVNRVTITNRPTSYSRINGAVIRIGNFLDIYSNTICGVISTLEAGDTATFSCGGMEGRYMVVHIPGDQKIISIVEVGVYGYLAGNRAIGGATIQSSTSADWFAERAVDGNRGLQQLYTGCSSTLNETDPWWRLDLQDVYRVHKVVVTNRKDCCAEQINGAEIRVGNSLENNGINNPICAVIPAITAGESYSYSCDGLEGRYVIIHIPGDRKILALCEVEVYGYLAENLAVAGAAIQSSTSADWFAEKAIDQGLQQLYTGCSSTLNETDPWWRLDLQDVYRVNKVVVSNRNDCCAEQINGAEIRVGNSLENNGINNSICAVIPAIPAGESYSYSCDGLDGRYVIIHIPGDRKILALCEVEVYGYLAENLAVAGATIQSSTSADWFAEKAIDRGLQQLYTGCSSTLNETDPWWRLDLQDVYRVNKVVVTNRKDCCAEQINGAEIRIGNSLENNGINNPICAVIPAIPAGESYSYSCDGLDGRYVIIYVPGDWKILALCEVEVYGYLAENLAVAGAAIQSSTSADWFAEKAIDRGLQQLYTGCSSTLNETDPWWRLDLQDVYRVSRVVVTNRKDCCAEQINGAEIRVGNSLENNGINNPICAVIPAIPAGESYSYSCDGLDGRYVIIHIPGDRKILALCEVEVYGYLAENLAVAGAAIQSSTSADWFAEKAIDQGLQQLYTGCSSTLNETDPWWRLDLQDVYRVSRVVVTNRKDCCAEQINGVEIRVGNSLENNGINNPICAVIPAIPAGESYSYSCDEMEGRYVNLIIPGDMKILTLCEVKVYGEGGICSD